MSVESTLTRELEIRFIDARAITTEAKLNLGITGYASEEQLQGIQVESIRIFVQERSEKERRAMRLLNSKLNNVKCLMNDDSSSSENDDCTSHSGRSYSTSSSNNSSGSKKMFSKLVGWPIVRRR